MTKIINITERLNKKNKPTESEPIFEEWHEMEEGFIDFGEHLTLIVNTKNTLKNLITSEAWTALKKHALSQEIINEIENAFNNHINLLKK